MSAATEFAPMSSLRLVPPEQPDDELSLDELGSRIVGLAGRLAAATCRWLLLVADFDARDGCARWGLANTAAWLMHTCALSRRTAFEHVRVARALAAHRQLAQDMETGRLSYSQVRAITRAVRPGDDETVADLSQAAQHCSIGQLETVVRGMRTCERNDEGTEPDDDDYVRTGWTSTSRWQLNARLAPEQGKLVESAIAALARAEGITHAEALVRMAELALVAVNDSEHPPRPLRGDERAAIVVHVNASDIPRGECSAERAAHSAQSAPPGDCKTVRVCRGPWSRNCCARDGSARPCMTAKATSSISAVRIALFRCVSSVRCCTAIAVIAGIPGARQRPACTRTTSSIGSMAGVLTCRI